MSDDILTRVQVAAKYLRVAEGLGRSIAPAETGPWARLLEDAAKETAELRDQVAKKSAA